MTFFNTFANFNITSFGFPPRLNFNFNFGWNINPFGGFGCCNNFGWNINPFGSFGCFNKVGLYGYSDPMSLSCFNYYGTPYNEPPSMYDTFNSSNAFDYTKINQSYQSWDMTTMPSLNSNMQYDWSNQIKQLKIMAPEKEKAKKGEGKTDNGDNINYASLSREEALEKAKNDPNLEELVTTTSSKGHKVIISSVDFENDIPYAKKGTMEILLKVADKIGKDITITSALGTSSSPHAGKEDQTGHYNPTNPKLDFGGGLTTAEAEELKTALENTGYFEFVSNPEKHGATAHLDTRIKEESYEALA